MNYPVSCQVFELVSAVAGCAGILSVFTLVPCCQQYPETKPCAILAVPVLPHTGVAE